MLLATAWLGASFAGADSVAYAQAGSVIDSREPLVSAAQDFERVETAVTDGRWATTFRFFADPNGAPAWVEATLDVCNQDADPMMWFRTDSASVFVRLKAGSGTWSRHRAKRPSDAVHEIKIDLQLPPEIGDLCGVRSIRLVEQERNASQAAIGTVFDETAPIEFATPASRSDESSSGGGVTGINTPPGGDPRPRTAPGGGALFFRAASRHELSRGVRARVPCPNRCRVKAHVLISAAMAKRYRMSTTVAVGTGRSPREGIATVTAKASARTRSRLRRAKSLRATLRVTMTDATGVVKRGTARIVLTR